MVNSKEKAAAAAADKRKKEEAVLTRDVELSLKRRKAAKDLVYPSLVKTADLLRVLPISDREAVLKELGEDDLLLFRLGKKEEPKPKPTSNGGASLIPLIFGTLLLIVLLILAVSSI